MNIQEQLSAWVDAHAEEYLRDLAALVAAPSVRGEEKPGMPFGEGCRQAVDVAKAQIEALGFRAKDYDHRVVTGDLNDLPAAVDILGHLDVVGVGDGRETDPFTVTEKDGFLYGRGTDDDKGPALAALYAMAAVRDLGLPMRGNARIILGAAEETGGDDLPVYYAENAPAPYTFSPDSGFPIYNVERGHYAPHFAKDWAPSEALPRVIRVDAGFRHNVIPGEAKAVVRGLLPAAVAGRAAAIAEACGARMELSESAEGVQITVSAKQGHAAMPQDANNALTAMLEVLSALPLADCGSTGAIRELQRLFPHGDTAGKALGIAMEDEISGPLTCSFTQLNLTETGIQCLFDARVPLCATKENCIDVTEQTLGKLGYHVEGGMSSVHHTPAESPFVQTLQKSYTAFTGKECPCLAMGGGTYVHNIPGGVAFGASMPGRETGLHGANERMHIGETLTACKIFALAIADLVLEGGAF